MKIYRVKESDLYPPLKAYLEAQGYSVKSEVNQCDVVAMRGDEPPVIVELKLNFNIDLVLQGVDRTRLTTSVYLGLPRSDKKLRNHRRRVLKLLRMLGFGLVLIDPKKEKVEVVLDPGPYHPRLSPHRGRRLLKEFHDRVGDPNSGGARARSKVMTAFRQRAISIATFLESAGPTAASEVAAKTGITNARDIMYRNVYGWFERESKGVYRLSPRGKREANDAEDQKT